MSDFKGCDSLHDALVRLRNTNTRERSRDISKIRILDVTLRYISRSLIFDAIRKYPHTEGDIFSPTTRYNHTYRCKDGWIDSKEPCKWCDKHECSGRRGSCGRYIRDKRIVGDSHLTEFMLQAETTNELSIIFPREIANITLSYCTFSDTIDAIWEEKRKAQDEWERYETERHEREYSSCMCYNDQLWMKERGMWPKFDAWGFTFPNGTYVSCS